jgi:hypothetical protein
VIGFSFIFNGNLSSTALLQETLIGIYICICYIYVSALDTILTPFSVLLPSMISQEG